MPARPFHHGNLRAVLLDRAEETLRERGTDGLSLRELAREAGVSHGAPRSHFVDKAALLDALAERGFTRFADALETASAHASGSYPDRLRATARAGLRFAVDNAAMLELMFTAKADEPPDGVRQAADRLFRTVTTVIEAGVAEGFLRAEDVGRVALLWSATIQGVSALVTSRRATIDQAYAVVDDAVALVLSGSLAT